MFKHSMDMKCERTSDGRTLDHHTLQVMRQQAAKAIREGQTVRSVAAACELNEHSIFRWLARFINGGQEALLAKPIPGRPSTITPGAPKRQTPVVAAADRRPSLNVLSAVGASGDFRFMLHDGSVTAGVFPTFLKRLMIGATRPIFLIVDGHSIHKAKMVKDYYVANPDGMLRRHYLPPYAPQLNPDEVVWAHVKRTISEQRVQSKEQMYRLALGALRRIQKLPDLVRSFFRQPERHYIHT